MRRDLPALLDILSISVEAGGSLAWALREVGERAEGPLASEWSVVAREVALGVPLSSALDGLAKRLPQPEIRAFVAALNRATRHGAPLADTLAGQARAARFALARRIREDAARAGPKIQLVVALLLVPSVLLLVAAALAAALLDGGGEACRLARGLASRGPPASRPTKSPFCTQACVQTRPLHAKRRSQRAPVPPRTTRSLPLYRAKTGAEATRAAPTSDGKVGNRVAEWGEVGYGAISNRPEWRGSSHSATPV